MLVSLVGATSSGVAASAPCTATVTQAYREAGSGTLGAVSPDCITRYQTAWCADVDPALVKSAIARVHPGGVVAFADPATVTCENRKTTSPGCQPAGRAGAYEPEEDSSPDPDADDRTEVGVGVGEGVVKLHVLAVASAFPLASFTPVLMDAV